MRTLVLLTCLALAACGSPHSTRSVIVAVTDPSGNPIEGVHLRTDPIVSSHPLNLADYFRSESPPLGRWRTDASGRATVVLLADHPTALTVIGLGFTPSSHYVPSSTQPGTVMLQPVDTRPVSTR